MKWERTRDANGNVIPDCYTSGPYAISGGKVKGKPNFLPYYRKQILAAGTLTEKEASEICHEHSLKQPTKS